MNGFEVTGCALAAEAFGELYESPYDLVISDVMMPHMDGFQFAQSIRQKDTNIPILLMTALDDLGSKRRGYLLGVDDYVTKPVDYEELLLRIGALLRRAKINESHRLEVGSLVMDLEEHCATCDGNEIPLTLREFNILYKLLSHPRKAFTRSQLMDEFWDSNSESDPRTVDVYVSKIRSKLVQCADIRIESVRGLGYKAVIDRE